MGALYLRGLVMIRPLSLLHRLARVMGYEPNDGMPGMPWTWQERAEYFRCQAIEAAADRDRQANGLAVALRERDEARAHDRWPSVQRLLGEERAHRAQLERQIATAVAEKDEAREQRDTAEAALEIACTRDDRELRRLADTLREITKMQFLADVVITATKVLETPYVFEDDAKTRIESNRTERSLRDQAEAKLARAERVLREVEWSGRDGIDHDACCPLCKAWLNVGRGHEKGCELAETLRAFDSAPSPHPEKGT